MKECKRILMLTGFLCAILLLASLAAPAASASSPVTVEPDLQFRMASDGSAGYLIAFREKADLTRASAMDWQSRGELVAQTLQGTARDTQARVRQYLDSHRVEHRSFWVANVIVVERSSKAILDGLLEFPEIESITARRTLPLPEPISPESPGITPQAIEPNIVHIKADQVWALGYDGTGIVVANIDGGVRYTHDALKGKYRGNLGTSFNHNYNWWDGTSSHSKVPIDKTDHGTHVMGIMVGDDGAGNRIGVAPGATWIACRGCDESGCPDEALISCGQFMLAPTDLMGNNPDPSKRPHVINNSWGMQPPAGGDKWYWAVVGAWQAAGIYPVFANGNDGPACGSVGTPGDFPNVTAVGNIDHTTDLPSDRSSRGPSVYANTINPMGYPYLKPQVSAPGMNIRSSIATGDNAYKDLSGTSMAAPHVTGLVALLLQAAPCFTYAQAEKIMMQTATPIAYVSGCGTEGAEGVPNNATGWGIIDALQAVNRASGVCGAMGALQGVVSSQSKPVPGATVTTDGRLTAITDEEGRYAFPHLTAGSHTVAVSRFGYYQESSTVAVKGISTTKDFNLQAKQRVTLTGKVMDGSGAGWPLYASIAVFTPGLEKTVHTAPMTGEYLLKLYEDTTYTLTVSSRGYSTETRTVTTARTFSPQNFAMAIEPSCSAPGYEGITAFFEDFEGDFPPAGWTTSSLGSTEQIWRRNDSFNAPNRTGGSGYCAQAGAEDPCEKWDAGLVSPPIDIPAGETATLFYENFYFQGGQPFETWVDVTTDGGETWHTLTDWTYSRGPLLEQVDLSGYAGTPFQIRWRYSTKGRWCSYYQQIDNVKVTSGCRLKPGGLVFGHVRDGNTGKPLSEITVGNDASETTATDDSGVYVLFSPAGVHTVTATPSSESGYGSRSRKVSVSEGKAVQRDLGLPAAVLSFSAQALRATLYPDGTTRKPLSLINDGGKSTSFRLKENTTATDVPWLSESPSEGTVSARNHTLIKVTFDATGLQEGTYTTRIYATGNTPYGEVSIPVTLKVVRPESFAGE